MLLMGRCTSRRAAQTLLEIVSLPFLVVGRNLQARVKSGLASLSVITTGCSILPVSIPSVRKVKSSAHSLVDQLERIVA